MTAEKPLHVRVAEALGCHLVEQASALAMLKPGDFYWVCGCVEDGGREGPHGSRHFGVRRYDTDWAATGPLIERFRLKVEPLYPGWAAWANETAFGGDYGEGPTPLIAACNLILALNEAGKLKEATR